MFTKLLGGHGFEFEIYSVVDGEFPSSQDEADGWLITGSRHGAYEDHDWIPPLEDLLRAIYQAGKPIVGICFGHQILAQALGGKVEKFKGGWAVGATEFTLTESGEKIVLNSWHQDQVVELPQDATVLATSPFCENAILAYGDKALSVQPHPEFGSGFVDGLIRTRGKGVVEPGLLDQAQRNLETPLSNDWMAEQISDFFIKSNTKEGVA